MELRPSIVDNVSHYSSCFATFILWIKYIDTFFYTNSMYLFLQLLRYINYLVQGKKTTDKIIKKEKHDKTKHKPRLNTSSA